MAGKMFSFITKTWNPIKFCSHDCVYCWAKKYGVGSPSKGDTPCIRQTSINFKPNDFVFVNDLGDLFCNAIPDNMIQSILSIILLYPKTKFLLMTKNPARYFDFALPCNCTLGCTIESNLDYPDLSKAPIQSKRIDAMKLIRQTKGYRDFDLFVSLEPILDFDLGETYHCVAVDMLADFVAVGYDNYGCRLKEPSLEKTNSLIQMFNENQVTVYDKTLRKAWWEA